MTTEKKTLDDLMAEYEPERQAEIAKHESILERRARERAERERAFNETPEGRAITEKRRALIDREIALGLRDADGTPIEQPSDDADDDETDDDNDDNEENDDDE